MSIRPFQPEDVTPLITIFRQAICVLGLQAYTKEQVEAWAASADNVNRFSHKLSLGTTLVYCDIQQPVAFAQLHPKDSVAMLYCHPDYTRSGIVSQLYRKLETQARRTGALALSADASKIGRPFLENFGFQCIKEESIKCEGVRLVRFHMSKQL